MSHASWDRIAALHALSRADVLVIVLFLQGHPSTSFTRAVWDFVRGIGPAAVARGRAGVRSSALGIPHRQRELRAA